MEALPRACYFLTVKSVFQLVRRRAVVRLGVSTRMLSEIRCYAKESVSLKCVFVRFTESSKNW